VDLKAEADFVMIGKRCGDNRSTSYGARRDAGVSAQVLKRAGVARARMTPRTHHRSLSSVVASSYGELRPSDELATRMQGEP